MFVEDATPVDGNCIEAWLIHCETPGRPRRHGSPPCEPAQSDRRQEIANVVTVAATPEASLSAPTSDAVFLGRSGCGDHDATRADYTSLNAASVKDPAGRAAMQVGPSSASDRNAFLISTAGKDGTLKPRIALDRFGNNRFTGNVTLADYHYCELVRLTDDKVLTLMAKAPGALGETLHLRMTPSIENGIRKLEAQIFSGTQKLGDPMIWKEAPDLDLSKGLDRFKETAIRLDAVSSVRMSPLFERAPIAVANKQAEVLRVDQIGSVQPQELFDRFAVQQDIAIHPCGGSLLINDWPASDVVTNDAVPGCDDDPLDDGDPPREPPGLSFLPMAKVPKAPPIPGIYSVRAGDEKNPFEELHLDLGEKRDSDLSTRFALGARGPNVNDPFVPWLEVNGICGVALPFPNPQLTPTSVHVNGTIQRGPIKPDVSDPAFTNLMSMAWLAGLQKGVVENPFLTVSFALPLTIVDTNHPFAYDVNVTNPSLLLTTAEGFIETLNVAGANPHIFPSPIKPAKPIPNNNAATLVANVTHIPQQLPAGTVGIYVVIYGKNNGAWWWKSHKEDFTIVAAPSLDKSGIPDSVPPNTPFDAVVRVRNEDDNVSFITHTVTIDGQVNASQDVQFAPHHAGNYTRHYNAGLAAGTDIQIDVAMEWQDTTLNAISDSKAVVVKDDLTASSDNIVAPTTATALQFDLNIDADNRPLTLVTVRQRLTSPDFPATPFTTINIAQPDLNAGDHLSIPGVTGAQLPVASNDVKLEIDIEYQRDGLTWHPPQPFVNEEVV